MQSEELEEVITAHYPQILSSLLLRFGTANQNAPRVIETVVTSPPIPSSSSSSSKSAPKPKTTSTSLVASAQIVQTFKTFLECGKDEQVSADCFFLFFSFSFRFILFILFSLPSFPHLITLSEIVFVSTQLMDLFIYFLLFCHFFTGTKSN
jgi:hypothetical protein